MLPDREKEESVMASVDGKISYIKPRIVDLGPVAAAFGADDCAPTGTSAAGSAQCRSGGYAGLAGCVGGSDPDHPYFQPPSVFSQ